MERRLHTRHQERTTVYIKAPGGQGKVCQSHNLSANGAFVSSQNLGLPTGCVVDVAFAVEQGTITRLHRRTAVVAHVTQGGTGLRMQSASAIDAPIKISKAGPHS